MKSMIRIAVVFYFVILFYIFFLARRRPPPTFLLHKEPVNFIPIKYKIQFFSYQGLYFNDKWNYFTDIFGNIILFIPLPFFLTFIFNIRQTRRILLIACLASICVEFMQFIFSIGVADIDDVILNTTGALIGAFLLKTTKKTFPRLYDLFNNQ